MGSLAQNVARETIKTDGILTGVSTFQKDILVF